MIQPVPMNSTRLAGELWGICTFFNPAGFSNKIENLKTFCAGVRRQGLRLLIVELAFGDEPFVVPDDISEKVLRFRSTSVLWQKERLLNLGLANLPDVCDKVAWLDADILFDNDTWVEETSTHLERFQVVQPFAAGVWLPAGVREAPQADRLLEIALAKMPSMACMMATAKADAPHHSNYLAEGHSGFAWAARRSVLSERGFYDAMILGGADLFMGHVMCGNRRVVTGRDWTFLLLSPKQRKHLLGWMAHFDEAVRGSVSFTRGNVLHLWHGSLAARDYTARFDILREEDFDPEVDIVRDENDCFRWAGNKPSLADRVRAYFHRRSEEMATRSESSQ